MLIAGLKSPIFLVLAVMSRSDRLCAIIGFGILALPLVTPLFLIGMMVLADWRAGRRKLLPTGVHRSRMRLALKLVGSGVIALLLIAVVAAWWRRIPQGEYELLTEGFASNPRLEEVSVEGFDRSFFSLESDYHAMEASMRIKGRAGAEIVFDHPAPDLFTGAAHVRLLRLGSHQFSNPGPDIGPEGELAALLPFRVATVDDVIDHYDELSALFDDLPARRLAHAQELVDRANQPQTERCVEEQNEAGQKKGIIRLSPFFDELTKRRRPAPARHPPPRPPTSRLAGARRLPSR